MSTRRSRSGGSYDREDVQAVEQVGPESSGTHVGREVAVRRRDDPHVDRHCIAADAIDRFRFQNAEQERLKFGGQFADFVEQQRPAVRRLEPSDTPANCSGERAGFVTEQFARGESSHEPAAVRRHKWSRRSPASSVNQSRDEFLPSAGFPVNENRRVATGDLFNRGAQ